MAAESRSKSPTTSSGEPGMAPSRSGAYTFTPAAATTESTVRNFSLPPRFGSRRPLTLVFRTPFTVM